MAKEPDQTKWVGIRPTDPSENIPTTTRKLLPAIGDLQAIKATLHHRAEGVNLDCSPSCFLMGVLCPADVLYVVTNITARNIDSISDIVIYAWNAAGSKVLRSFYSVEPRIEVSWQGVVVLEEGERTLVDFSLGGNSDDVKIDTHGYIIGLY